MKTLQCDVMKDILNDAICIVKPEIRGRITDDVFYRCYLILGKHNIIDQIQEDIK